MEKTPLLLKSLVGSFFEQIAPSSSAHEVEKWLIKLAWSPMLGVKEIPKVQTVDHTLYVWLCDRLSTFLTAFATSSPSSHSIRYSSSVLPTTFEMAHPIEPLTPFNYHQWKADMVVMLYTKGLFRLIEEAEEEPDLDKDKAKYMNRLDEANDALFSL